MKNQKEKIEANIGPDEAEKFVKSMRLSRLVLPILLGVLGVVFLFYKQFDAQKFRAFDWTSHTFYWIFLGFILLILRHLAYTVRMRALTNFGWLKSAAMVVMWEFAGAITPTSKGGPVVMFFVLNREGLTAGKTAAAVLYCIVCDSGFMVVMLSVLLWFFGPPMLYPGMKSFSDVGLASGAFFFTFGFMVSYWLVFMFFLFFRPGWAGVVLQKIGQVSFLKKFAPRLAQLGIDFKLAAEEIHQQKFSYHFRVIFGTFMAWTLKFAMINCLILAIAPETPLDGSTQLFIYARMVAMFIIMAFSPTPGGAGLAEVAMAKFISDFVPVGLGVVVALLWRGMAYYGYLLLGALVVPAWINEKILKKRID